MNEQNHEQCTGNRVAAHCRGPHTDVRKTRLAARTARNALGAADGHQRIWRGGGKLGGRAARIRLRARRRGG